MLISCIVKGCCSIQSPDNPQLVFYRLPWNNIQLRTEWVKLAGYNPYNADDVKHITKDHCICSLHFASNTRGISKQMVPHLNLPEPEPEVANEIPNEIPDEIPNGRKPNNMGMQTRRQAKIAKMAKITATLRQLDSKKHHTSKQQSTLIEDDIGRSIKRAKKEFHSNSSILEEESFIDQRSVAQSQLINSAKPVESSVKPVSTQTLYATFEPPISHVIPPKQKRVLIISSHQQSVMTNLSSLWKAGKLCDAIISNGTANVKIHKMVLCAVCPKMLTIFDNISLTKFPKVSFPTNTSKEALMAFTEYLYDGVLDLDARILEQLIIIAQWLDMKDFEQLCESQLKMAYINDDSNSRLELVAVDVKQEVCCSNNTEDLNVDPGVVVEGYSYALKDSTHAKEETENNNIQIKVEQDDPEEQKYASGAFYYGANNDVFLPDFSSQDRNFSLVPTSDVQQNASASDLPSLSFSSRQSSTLLPASLYQNVNEPMIRPVGYITPTSEQKLITKEMVNMISTNPHSLLTVNDNAMPLKLQEVPVVTVKKEYYT